MLKKRGPIWHYDIGHNGQRVRGTTGASGRKEAQRIHDQIKADMWRRAQDARKGHTLADALKLWLKAAQRSVNEKNALRQFLGLYPNRALIDIKGTDIAQATAHLSAATANRMLSNIRAALKLGGWSGIEQVMIYAHLAPGHLVQWAGNFEGTTAQITAQRPSRKPKTTKQAIDFNQKAPVAQWIEQPLLRGDARRESSAGAGFRESGTV